MQTIWDTRPLIFSGPCSAETEEQVMATAKALVELGKINVFRAGVWKPRTRPGNFEGNGTKALPWLQKAKKETGIPIAVEVATTKQLEDALHFGVDILWIGARTTANPFSVQEIADALRGVDVPVFIKNPINPDLELWCGAVERIAKAGVKKIGLIHRGFSAYSVAVYRNAPMWHIAIDMQLKNPTLPILNDPSHICGNRTHLLEVAQKAIDLNFDGLMIESHISPATAWSDAKQQITPQQLDKLLTAIHWRQATPDGDNQHIALQKFRQHINQLDEEIMQLIVQRMKVADEIGWYKKENNITILQPSRFSEIMERGIEKGEKMGLTKDFVTKYLETIHMESIDRQNKIMNS